MKLILKEEVEHLGSPGDLVDVKGGYAPQEKQQNNPVSSLYPKASLLLQKGHGACEISVIVFP